MTAMLNVKDLRAYYGQVQALHGLDFGLNEGSMTTLLGANGAGKTTTLRAICNMVRSTGAIGAEQRRHAAFVEMELEAVQRLHLTVVGPKVLDIEHRGHWSLLPR